MRRGPTPVLLLLVSARVVAAQGVGCSFSDVVKTTRGKVPTRLDFSGCVNVHANGNFIGDGDGAQLFAQTLRQRKPDRMAGLQLTGNSLGDKGVAMIAPAMTKLKVVYFINQGMGDEGARAVAALLADPKCEITHLAMQLNKVGIAGAAAIVAALKNNTVLGNFDFRANEAGDAAESLLTKIAEMNLHRAFSQKTKVYADLPKDILAAMEPPEDPLLEKRAALRELEAEVEALQKRVTAGAFDSKLLNLMAKQQAALEELRVEVEPAKEAAGAKDEL
jgi:hypothetical protein